MTVRDVSFADAYKMCSSLVVKQYPDEIEGSLDKCSSYLGDATTILEIGSYHGGTLALLGRLMKGTPNDLLISVSLSNNGKDGVDVPAVSELVHPSKVVYLDMKSSDAKTVKAVRDVLGDRSIDVLFIDADHSYAASIGDYRNYVDLCKPKSIIAFHDVLWTGGGVVKTWDEVKRGNVTEVVYKDRTGYKPGEYEPKWLIVNRGIGILYKGMTGKPIRSLGMTRADNNYMHYAKRVEASFKYFHPDIDFITLQAEDYIPIVKSLFTLPFGTNKLSMQCSYLVAYWKMLSDHYDLIMHFDADTVITGRLDEMLTGDFEVAVSESVSTNFPNAGVWAATSSNFMLEFFLSNIGSPARDNSVFVDIMRRHTPKLLDGPTSKVWYNERSRKFWDQLTIKDDKLWTPDRQIKVLHWAGGKGWGKDEKLSCSLFSDDVKQWLNKIANTDTFTSHDGVKFGNFIKGIPNG